MFAPNRLITMLENGEVPLGMQCFTGNAALIEVLGHTGFDFVMIDTEHCGTNPRAIEDEVRAADGVGLVPIVRVPEVTDEPAIRRALEAGAQGLMVPMVKSAEDVARVADSAFFPPVGNRGTCPSIRSAGYNFRSYNEFTAWNNENVMIIPLIEHPDGVDHIEEICAREEVRVVVFGQGDLAAAMGEGNKMLKSPLVQEAYRKVLAAAEKHGVAVMGGPVLEPSQAGCEKAIADGVRVLCLGLDIMGFRSYCEDTVALANRAVANSAGLTRPAAPESGFPEH